MSTTPFLFVCLVFFGAIAIYAIPDLLDGTPFETGMAAFFIIMAVLAAGLLLLPTSTI